MSKHQAKFTWGAGPNKVTIAGGFNEWSDSATPLQKQADGSFAADVPLPWGEKQAFKYVVDGEWKVREDEAKEWDAAGNMNNVYTAPHPPAADAPKETAPTKENETSAAAPAVAATSVPVAAEHTKSAPSPTEAIKSEPAVSEASAPAPSAPATKETEPSSLLASWAPSAASKGPSGIPTLGAVTLPTSHAAPPKAVETHATAAPVPSIPVAPVPAPAVATAAVPIDAAPKVTDSTPVKIEKTAANANIGQAPNGTEAHTIQETAQEYAHQAAEVGAGALASIGAAVGSAVLAVENATGVHILGGQPLTVEEARAKGIDISTLEKKDAPTDALSPVGTKPPADAVKDLEEKTKELKLNAGKGEFANTPEPLDSVNHRKNDIPAQNEVDNHKTIPGPQITPVAPKDPKKERSLDAATSPTTASTKPVSTDPAVDAKQAKKEAENSSSQTGSTQAVAQGKHIDSTPPNPVTSQPGKAAVRPDAPSNNIHTDAPPTPPKDKAPLPAAAAPATPAKVNGTPAAAAVTPGSIASTPASTPAKAAHTREETNGSDVRKRKSSFFTKIKHAFSPKDKEKK